MKISGLVNYGDQEEPQIEKKASAPPRLTAHKPSQKRSLGDSSASTSSKTSRREVETSPVSRPAHRPRREPLEPPSAPDDIQASYLTLEMEVDGQEENTGEEEVENIPFVLGKILNFYLNQPTYSINCACLLLLDADGRYQPIEGRRRGSNLIADVQEGYVYRIRRYFNGKQYYRCCYKEKCPGRLVCHEGRFHTLNQHDHDGGKAYIPSFIAYTLILYLMQFYRFRHACCSKLQISS